VLAVDLFPETLHIAVAMLGGLLKTLRPHQWVKNLFVLAPVVFAKEAGVLPSAGLSLGAFLVFCLSAGAVYTLNDIVDVEKDRRHPVKRNRPIAAGRVPVHAAAAFASFLFAVSVVGAVFLGIPFTLTAVSYIVLNLAYSFWLKNIFIIDVICIATGFLLRVLAGCFAVRVQPSAWLLGCTFLLALFLALGKRRHELSDGPEAVKHRAVLRFYSPRFLAAAMYVTAVLTAAAYTVYTLSGHTLAFFGTRWFAATVPFVLFGLVRFVSIVNVRKSADSPTDAMLRDVPFVANILAWAAVVLGIIYLL
jgi:4-hydroxybenzoate polyprenyltransferase